MKVTLLDEQGIELTEIMSRLGRSSGQMLVDWALRPGALFHYYFGRGERAVTMVENAEQYACALGTRWQRGSRIWFLHAFDAVISPVQTTEPACFTPESGLVAATIPLFYAKDANTDLGAPAIAYTSEPLGVPT